MATNTQARFARQLPILAMTHLTKTVNFNDTGANGTAQPFDFYLPDTAVIHYVLVRVTTAFSGGSAYTYVAGQNSSTFNDMVASGDTIDLTTTGAYMVLRGADLVLSTEVLPKVLLGWSGTTTTGVVKTTIVYHAA